MTNDRFEEKLRNAIIEARKVQRYTGKNGKPVKRIMDLALLLSPEKMLIVAEILSAVRTYDRTADVAGLLKKLDERLE